MALRGFEEFNSRHAIAVTKAHQAAFITDQLFVNGIELLNKAFDPVVVQ